jgi:4'-phosphopantetheinyl transferase
MRAISIRAAAPAWSRVLFAAFLLHMLQSGSRVGAFLPRACFANLQGSFARGIDVRPRRHTPLRNVGREATAQLQLRRRALVSLTCSLRTSFPNGLLSGAPHAQGAGVGDGVGDGVGVLDEHSIHVWMVQTEDIESRGNTVLDALRDTLSESEMQRYQRSMATPKAREQALSFLVARALLRCTLSRYCPQVAPTCWRFEVNSYGRPALCSELQRELLKEEHNASLQDTLRHLSRLRFNLSHCAGMVVCAFAYGREVGIDSENVNAKRRIASIARRFFTKEETDALLSVPEDAQPLTFSRLWTLKEAYVKARGLGISGVGLDNFEFKHVASFSQERPAGALTADLSKAGDKAEDWQFVIFDPPLAHQGGGREGAEGDEGEGGEGGARHGDDARAGTGVPGVQGGRGVTVAGARHAVSLAAGCAGGKSPASVSIFKTFPLASAADELVDFAQVAVLSSHESGAGGRGLGAGEEGDGRNNATAQKTLVQV